MHSGASKSRTLWRILAAAALAAIVAAGPLSVAQQAEKSAIRGGNGVLLPPPPPTQQIPVTDDLHGTKIVDPYRWLEDAKSPETRAWIDAQNQYTGEYLRQVPLRDKIRGQLERLVRADQVSIPTERHGRYFFSKRLATENQGSIYVRDGWKGEDHRLVDATSLSADQNTSVSLQNVSTDGSLLAYGVRQGGADEEEIHVLTADTGKDLADRLPPDLYYGVVVAPDDKGLYYAPYHAKDGGAVLYHPFGGDPAKDTVVLRGSYRGHPLGNLDQLTADLSDDGHFLVITIDHGTPATRQDILVKDLRQPDSEIVPLVYGVEAHFEEDEDGDTFYVRTDLDAPKGRIVRAKIGVDPHRWFTVVPEGTSVLSDWSIVDNKLFVQRLVDVKSDTTIYSLEGARLGKLTYPGIGTASAVYGHGHGTEGFYNFQSYNLPPTIFRYDTQTKKTDVFAKSSVPFDSSSYEVTQVFYHSKDGTRVPMFLAARNGRIAAGNAQVLLTAYGGFDVNEDSHWSSVLATWMEQGGIVAVPNLRGGGEYGEEWHKAGMFEKKQNVFDDFYAAAQYLIDQHITTPQRLAILGGSNGGLLMGAALTQRPELFGAVLCTFPLLDMLRYQNFLIGRTWTTEYGSAENEEQFRYIYRYSPYHNVTPGTKFPAIMFFTGDSDTRVDPLHARKMTARVQAANGGDRPVLLHYSVKGGHSAGLSVEQSVADGADELAFLWNETSAK